MQQPTKCETVSLCLSRRSRYLLNGAIGNMLLSLGDNAVEVIIGVVVLFFVLRFFFVLGRAKSTAETNASNGREIYALCKSRGMDINDIHSVEYDPKAMVLMKNKLATLAAPASRIGRSRNELIAQSIYETWKRKQNSYTAYVVIDWGIEHELPQFIRYRDRYSKGDPLSISEEDINEVFSLQIISAEVGAFRKKVTVRYIPDEVFMLPHLECLFFGIGGCAESFSVKLDRIPESIQCAKNLKSLHLQYCGLTELPRHIFVPWLEELKIGGNNIRIIPDGIESATSLRMLTAWANDLEYVSEKIGTLKNLKRIDFLANPSLKLPKSIVNLGDMEELYIEEDLPGLTPEQITWLKRNNSLVAEAEEGTGEPSLKSKPRMSAPYPLPKEEDLPF